MDDVEQVARWVGLAVAALALPVRAIVMIVGLQRDVAEHERQSRARDERLASDSAARDERIAAESAARVEAHERTCEERMHRLDERWQQLQQSLHRIEDALLSNRGDR